MAAPSFERSLQVFLGLALLVENGKERKRRFRHLEECSESAGKKGEEKVPTGLAHGEFPNISSPWTTLSSISSALRAMATSSNWL
jgi:hypothetical protein